MPDAKLQRHAAPFPQHPRATGRTFSKPSRRRGVPGERSLRRENNLLRHLAQRERAGRAPRKPLGRRSRPCDSFEKWSTSQRPRRRKYVVVCDRAGGELSYRTGLRVLPSRNVDGDKRRPRRHRKSCLRGEDMSCLTRRSVVESVGLGAGVASLTPVASSLGTGEVSIVPVVPTNKLVQIEIIELI